MAERPILFSAPMARALLDGRKTQTRRTVKRQPVWRQDILSTGLGDPCPGVLAYQESPGIWHHYGSRNFCEEFCPYGKPGDTLWVREAFIHDADEYDYTLSSTHPYYKGGTSYRADFAEPCGGAGWKPSIHMPRSLSRITLKITDVRVQRLQDISEEDAVAEGVPIDMLPIVVSRMPYPTHIDCGRFAALWESINGAGSWDGNPWVWALSFEVQR